MRNVIITSPSLDTRENVSGVSAVVRFIIDNNNKCKYQHFCIGKKDNESGGVAARLRRLSKTLSDWRKSLRYNPEAVIHYSYPLDYKSVVRDFVFMWIAKLMKRKLVVHVHGGLYLTKLERPWLVDRILKRVFLWQSPVIVLSDEEKKNIQRLFGAKDVTVLPNCVPLDEAMSFSRDIEKKDVLDLLYIGRIEVKKGMDYLLEACKALKAKNTPFRLHIAGREEVQNEYLPAFESALGDCFVYEGVVSGDNKTQLLKKCDVLVLPSFYEGLPMALVECMSFSMIPICTNVGSISSVLEDGVNGFFVPVKSHNEIVDKIERINNDRDMAQHMSTAAKKVIVENFSPGKYVETLNDIYESLTR